MKQVGLIRQRIAQGQKLELQRLKQFISMIDGGNAVIDRLSGSAGEELLAGVQDLILAHMGHVAVVPASETGSRAARSVRALMPSGNEIAIDSETAERLRRLAPQAGKTMSELIADAVGALEQQAGKAERKSSRSAKAAAGATQGE